MSSSGQNKSPEKIKNQKGQLVLEYVLLMLIAVAMATLIKNQLIGGNPDDIENSGVISKMVYGLTNSIASDTPGE